MPATLSGNNYLGLQYPNFSG